MPLFNKKFESKPIPVRIGRCSIGTPPVSEDLDEYKNLSLQLGNKELKFIDGAWIHCSRKGDVDDIAQINKKNKSLQEENNFNLLKIDVLLDLLAEHASELNSLKSFR